MTDDIDVHYDSGGGELSLTCSDEAFVRVRDAVIVAADLGGVTIDGVPDGVQVIVVNLAASAKSPARLRDRLALLGCGLVGFGVLLVLAVGVITIAGWVR